MYRERLCRSISLKCCSILRVLVYPYYRRLVFLHLLPSYLRIIQGIIWYTLLHILFSRFIRHQPESMSVLYLLMIDNVRVCLISDTCTRVRI